MGIHKLNMDKENGCVGKSCNTLTKDRLMLYETLHNRWYYINFFDDGTVDLMESIILT